MHLLLPSVLALAAGLSVVIPPSSRLAQSAERVRQDSSRCAPSERLVDITTLARNRPRPAFAAGEEFHYSASFEKLHITVPVGSAEMRFFGRDTVRGRDAWKAWFVIGGGWFKLTVHDTTMSWFDSLTFNSYRFVQNLHDPGYHAARDTQIFPDELVYRRDGKAHPSVADPLDDISFVYFVRTLPLEPGQCYVFRRYFQPEGNPVVVHVVQRDTISVPAGRFPALVIRPEITTSHLFSKNGRASLWLADDSTHAVLKLETHLSFGSIYLYLRHVGRESGD